jgi:hypothetical protein
VNSGRADRIVGASCVADRCEAAYSCLSIKTTLSRIRLSVTAAAAPPVHMNTTLELTRCPDPACGSPAEVAGRWTLGSTSGPLVMAQTRCLNRHTFVLPVTWLRSG